MLGGCVFSLEEDFRWGIEYSTPKYASGIKPCGDEEYGFIGSLDNQVVVMMMLYLWFWILLWYWMLKPQDYTSNT